MKKRKEIKPLHEIRSGLLEGGFAVLASKPEMIIAGVAEPTNNCDGGTCTNNCAGGNCGNCAKGCGVKQ